jgi:hypothetical protein
VEINDQRRVCLLPDQSHRNDCIRGEIDFTDFGDERSPYDPLQILVVLDDEDSIDSRCTKFGG